VLEALRLLLKAEGYLMDLVESPTAVVTALGQRDYDVVLIDLNYARDTTSGEEGLELLRRIHDADASMPVVVMTAWGSVHLAVEAMRRGARDFIEKPWDNERLLSIIRTQLQLGQALRRASRLEAQTKAGAADAPPFIATAPGMQEVLQIIERVGPSDANVLITGENGTGKSLVANALHAASPRSARAMVTINAGGVAEGATAVKETIPAKYNTQSVLKADVSASIQAAQGTMIALLHAEAAFENPKYVLLLRHVPDGCCPREIAIYLATWQDGDEVVVVTARGPQATDRAMVNLVDHLTSDEGS